MTNVRTVKAEVNVSDTALSPEKPFEQKTTLRSSIALTTSLIVISLVAIAGGTLYLWDLPWGMGSLQLVINSCNGMLLALPILISIWIALGNHTWLIRIPLAFGTMISMLSVFFLSIASYTSPTPPEVYYLFASVAFAVTTIVQIPLWISRIWMNLRITQDASPATSASSQFSIRQLMISTALVAVLIPLCQWLIEIGQFDGGTGIPATTVIGFCAIFIVVMVFLAGLALAIVFGSRTRLVSIGILCLALILIPVAILQPLGNVLGAKFAGTNRTDMGLNVAAFSTAHALTLIGVLSLYRLIGFRIERITNTN